MQSQIVEKLRRVLAESVQTEERVVYILVETRKLMEHANLAEGELVTLEFFCDWVPHTKLTRSLGAKIVQLINYLISERLSGRRMTEEQHEQLTRTFSLDQFRYELLCFLEKRGLNGSVLEKPEEWTSFV